MKILARRAAQAIGAERCSIDLWQDGRLMPVMSQFADGHADPDLWAKYMALGPRRPEEHPTYVEVVRTRRPVAVDEVTDPQWLAFGARALLMVPLLRQDAVLGTIHLDQAEPYRWAQAEIDFAMTIANQAALAADNARLYEQVRTQLRELQETQAQLLQAGKLAAVGKLVAGVAHELNNPLAVVLGQADLLTQHSSDPVVLKRTDKIRTSARRAAKIVRELTTFARPQPAAVADVQIADIVEHALELRRQALSVRGTVLKVDVAPDLRGSPCPTAGRAFVRRSCRGSSSRSSPRSPSAKARGWGCRSPSGSSRLTAGASGPRACRAAAPRSPSRCRPSRGRRRPPCRPRQTARLTSWSSTTRTTSPTPSARSSRRSATR
ncbi:MAG: hypothetical protein DMD94_27430 [Candidatus Rokuibacteriota bacterium]|nr:MAG: hypothetical protein DMD94_27430 [Candidatus Rokubacteria bacterium]